MNCASMLLRLAFFKNGWVIYKDYLTPAYHKRFYYLSQTFVIYDNVFNYKTGI